MKITFLGTGSSLGIPVIGCGCNTCNSSNSKNMRDRPSILIETEGKTLLIDTSPDFRQQAIRQKIQHIDAVLFTHAHADHIFGFDDLRILIERKGETLPVFGSDITIKILKSVFAYAFETNIWKSEKPRLAPVCIQEEFVIQGIPVVPIPVLHQNTEVYGFRFGKFAYITDVSFISEESLKLLDGLEYLVISALRIKPHPKHMELDDVIALVNSLGLKRTWITHISHELEHNWLIDYLPDTMEPAFDGLVIEL
jgi:phosphoribosyl 1,2-cyclic phosphate phosphodiesterase